MRRLLAVTVLATMAVVVWAGFTHRVSYVITHGVSMQPLYHTGDLVVVARKHSYRQGDIVTYQEGQVHILHRIIGGDGNGFVTKGDNNQSIDPFRPTGGHLLGSAVLHVPSGGVWLRHAISPPVLAAEVFLMVLGIGRTVRRRRRRRRETVGRHSRPPVAISQAAPYLALRGGKQRTVAAVTAAVGLLGVLLTGLGWTQPPTDLVAGKRADARSMTFSYLTKVPRTAAYDDTVVRSPQPVFRSVANSLDVTYAYAGPAGTVTVDAQLSLTSGWRTTVPLAPPRSFGADGHRGTVRLDLNALETRARAGQAASGIPAAQLSVTVVPRVTNPGRAPFTPELALSLTSLELTLAGGALSVADPAPAPHPTRVPRTVHAFGREAMAVSTARDLGAALLLGALLAAAALGGAVYRQARPATEADRIRRRHRQLLAEVEPMALPADRLVVHVPQFAALARLAERYGLLVLFWTTPQASTFVVRDDGVTYCYSTGPSPYRTGPPERHGLGADPEQAPYHWQLGLPGAQDTVTDLANRSLFEDEVQYVLNTQGGDRLYLMLIDVTQGEDSERTQDEPSSDTVLVAVAERLRRVVRPQDLVARLDGNRFAVLFEDVDSADLTGIAGRMTRTVGEPLIIDGTECAIQPWLGIAGGGPVGDATELMSRARTALRQASARKSHSSVWRSAAPGTDRHE